MPERIIDINGYLINHPPGYEELKQAGYNMIDSMEQANTERADMLAALHYAFGEIMFQMVMLPERT
jgi:hypothetical protein